MKRTTLLTVDGIINLVLGVFLVWYPTSIAAALGLPAQGQPFFARILGGVLFGVGVALLIERNRPPLRPVGLGLGGAVSINLCGGTILGALLLVDPPGLTVLGQLALWTLVLLLVGLSSLELLAHRRHRRS